MKSMTKLMVVAMLLVAALVVAPAAARTVDTVFKPADGNTAYIISSGDTVYVGEKNLNFAAGTWSGPGVTTPLSGGYLAHFTDTVAGTTDVVVGISNANDFELTSSDFGTTKGTYYVFADGAPIKVGSEAGTVFVDIPKVTLDAVLNKSPVDSVNGKSVTRDNKLDFKLINNLAGFRGVTDGVPEMKIEVTLPGGGVTTKFGTVELDKIPMTGETQYRYGVDLENEKAGSYSAVAKWPSSGPGASFYGKNYDSNPVTFEILTKKLAISADKDTVVRGKSFSVTITGESKQPYFLFVKDAGLNARDEYPTVRSNQNGVKNDTKTKEDYTGAEWDTLLKNVDNKTVPKYAGTHAFVETNAGGTRTVQFDTSTETDDRQFTIRVQDLVNKGTYDEVKVRVEKGTVTVTASGTGVYYLGEEITLSGTNTDSEYVYLFLTGPNLGTNGVNLETLKKVTDNTKEQGLDGSFTRETVEADDTWSYKWNTAELGKVLDAGGYTVYAASAPQGKDNLSDVEYATVSVQLKSAYLTATSSGAKIAKGDDLKITGTAQGDPDNVQVWIFGKNYYGKNNQLVDTATVESDGSFEYELKSGETKELSPGQYFAVIQHPMTNGYGVTATGTKIFAEDLPVGGVDLGKLQASAAATALINALDSPNVDDTYVKLTFDVEEAYITIDPIGDKEAGSKFTISGTTNVAVGDKLIIDVTSAAFGPAKKTEAAGFGSVSGTATVEKGDGVNKWSFEVDAADLKPDQYIVKAECIETSTTTTANFNLVEAVETTPTTVTTTAPAVETTTTVPAGEETTEPTPTPGFGALVALAGLGAVAFLVLRRK